MTIVQFVILGAALFAIGLYGVLTRKNAVLVGPGCGLSGTTRRRSLAALRAGKATVLDADAITVFKDFPERATF